MQHGSYCDRLHFNIKVQCNLGQYCVQFLSYSTKTVTEGAKRWVIPTAVAWGVMAKLCIVITHSGHIKESGVVSIEIGSDFVPEKCNRLIKIYH